MKTDSPTTTVKPSQQLQAVLDHQKSVALAQQEVQRLQGLKTGRQERVAYALKVDGSLRDMEKQMQDLLADIEAGEPKQKELDALRSEYARASDSLGDVGYDEADDVLAGLDRKIERAQAGLKELQEKRPALMRAMLMEQAEALGGEYAAAALKTLGLYHRLCALNLLLFAHGRTMSLSTGANLELPLFELEAVRPHVDFHLKSHIVRGPFLRGQVMEFEKAERQWFANLGVDMALEGA